MNAFSRRIKGILLWTLLLTLIAFASVSAAESINIPNLYEATDEELAEAHDKIVAEQKSRIKVAMAFPEREANVSIGKSIDLKVEVTGIPEDAKETASEWESSRPNVATVKNGSVKGISAGKTVISCRKTYSNDIVLEAACIITVDIPVRKIEIPDTVIVGVGKTTTIKATTQPENATSTELGYASSDPTVASVSESGEITGMGMGRCEITVWAKDSERNAATATVIVPALSADRTEYQITDKSGIEISLQCIGSSAEKIDVKNLALAYFDVETSEYSRGESVLTLNVKPLRAGKGKIRITDTSSKETVELTIEVDHSAVYDTVSYPAIVYDNVLNSAEEYAGENGSVTGEIISRQALGDGMYLYKLYTSPGEREWTENEVEVLVTTDTLIPLRVLERDVVTVYGTVMNHGESHSESTGTAGLGLGGMLGGIESSSSTSTGVDLTSLGLEDVVVVSAEKIEIK